MSYIVPSVCTLALLVGGIVAINPILDYNKVYAINDCGNEGCNSYDSDSTPKVSLTVTPNAADSTNGNVTVGEPAYFSNTVVVGGSNISQYSLTLNTANGSNGELIGQDNPYATVNKISSNTSPAHFPDNTWGYAISEANAAPDKTGLTYNPVPGTDTNNSAFLDFKKGLSGTISNTYKLVFAAKLGSGMPADHYKTDVYLSAVASATETAENWFRNTARITTMQEMNSDICSSAPEHATSQLMDTRDNKLYWVTKLKDGNCWMTQNLDYDGGGRLFSIREWSTGDGGAVLQTTAAYYDPGNYVYNLGPNGQNGSCLAYETLGDCPAQFSVATTTSNLHYHIGNYYSWNAATKGSGGELADGQAVDSVCPNGWRLPTGNSNGDFEKLMLAYGWSTANQSAITMNDNNGVYGSPLYFIYGGHISGKAIFNTGNQGIYWTSTTENKTTTYDLHISNYTSPRGRYSASNRYIGQSVRCLAK